jgi:hypothetical protein
MIRRVGLLTVALMFAGVAQAVAKRAPGYVPPPYAERVARALLGLMPAAAILGGASFFLTALFRSSFDPSRRTRFIAGVLTLAILGAAFAATEWLSNEPWNVAVWGTPFLALIPLVGLIVLLPRMSLWKRILAGLVLIGPVFIAATFATSVWQEWGGDLGVPNVW